MARNLLFQDVQKSVQSHTAGCRFWNITQNPHLRIEPLIVELLCHRSSTTFVASSFCLAIWIKYVDVSIIQRFPRKLFKRLS